MAEKELRKLKRRELLQMLLIQCEEAERLQQETDEMKEHMDTVMESYERLKKKLDIKDERLNQKDAKIAELKREIEELKTAKVREQGGVDVVTEALDQLNLVFEEVQKSVEHYMGKTKKADVAQNPFEVGRAAGLKIKQASSRGQIVPMSIGKTGSMMQNKASLAGEAKASGEIYG